MGHIILLSHVDIYIGPSSLEPELPIEFKQIS